MSLAEEGLEAPSSMAADLVTGVEAISQFQDIVFELYVRLVMPLDGYVFWVKAASVSNSALINAMMLNAATPNGPQIVTPRPSFVIKGSFHYATDNRQNEAANVAVNRVVFTSIQPVQDFNAVNDNLMYIGTFDAPLPGSSEAPASTTRIRFGFSSRGTYYRQTTIHHYIGEAVYSTMGSQIVDDPRTLDTRELIVSNSLPAWLAFNQFEPDWPVPVPRPRNVTLFPSFLVSDNLAPPFGAVHIEPGATESAQSIPVLGPDTSSALLARDRVTLTLYGCSNRIAQDVMYSLIQYSVDTDLFGILNMPIIKDDKEGQNEFNTLAMKKRIEFDVSYNQLAQRDAARQLILTCIPTFIGE